MGKYRILGIVQTKDKKDKGYFIYNEKITKVVYLDKGQLLGLFTNKDFINAELDQNGNIVYKENAKDRFQYYNEMLQPMDNKRHFMILDKLVHKSDDKEEFRFIDTKITPSILKNNGFVQTYTLEKDAFIDLMAKPDVVLVNGKVTSKVVKLESGKEVKKSIIQGIKKEIKPVYVEDKPKVVNPLKRSNDSIKKSIDLEEKKKEKAKVIEENKKEQRREYRKQQHLKKIVTYAMHKINKGNDLYRFGYYPLYNSLYKNIKIIQDEVYDKSKDKLSSSDVNTINKLYMYLMEILSKNPKIDTLLLLPRNNLETYHTYLYAYLSYLFDVYDKDIDYINKPLKIRKDCISKNIGSKKLVNSYEIHTKKELSKIYHNKYNYWQYPTKLAFNTEQDLKALGYTLNKGELAKKVSDLSYNKTSKGSLKYLDFTDFEFFNDNVTCIGDYLLPYNIAKSIIWLADKKANDMSYFENDGERKLQKLYNRIEVKLAVLALYNPEKAKIIYDMCTENGTDLTNWTYLPNFDYNAPSKLNKEDIERSLFYRSAGNIVHKELKAKEQEEGKTEYILVKRHKVECASALKDVVKEVKKIVSSNCDSIESIDTMVEWVHLIPNFN